MLEDSDFLRSPEGLSEMPILRPLLTGKTPRKDGVPRVEGDDEDYRYVLVDDDGQRLVALTEEDGLDLRPIYDGVDPIDGSQNSENNLPGGLDGQMYVRESVAIGLREFAAYLRERHGSRVKPIIVDAFRSFQRQAAGFSGLLDKALGANRTPDTRTFFDAGVKANGTFSFVKANTNSAEVQTFMNDMRETAAVYQELELIGEELGISMDDILLNYTAFCVNLRIRQCLGFSTDIPNPYNGDAEKERDVDFENNAHAGGGAVDMFLGVDGKIASSLAPYDSLGRWAAKEATEDDRDFETYKREAQIDPELSGFLNRLGIKPQDLTIEQWQFAKRANRVLHHATRHMGATYYSATNPINGGENWHIEFGNVIRRIQDGRILHRARSSSKYWNSGNPGHALQRMPDGKAVAVWGGTAAHRQLGLI